jgi:hypothetical protein
MVRSKVGRMEESQNGLAVEPKPKLLHASVLGGGIPTTPDYSPYIGTDWSGDVGLTPEKLVVPNAYHAVLEMVYDFYQRGGSVATVINRMAEFTVTNIKNGQRETSDEANTYFDAILHRKPSRMLRFLRTCALEYFLSGMVVPRVDWVPIKGKDWSPDLKPGKTYYAPVFDLYPPKLVLISWAGWGAKKFYIKIPAKDVRLIKSGGSRIKEQQLKYDAWVQNYPSFVAQVRNGSDKIELQNVDPILRKEVSISQYPTPFLFPVLEPLLFKQQLRRMDFAVASRVINAILLISEGDKDFPLTEENQGNLNELKQQIQMRSGNAAAQERLFMLFSNHTTKLEWITPDVSAMLDQEKYRQTNEEIESGLGFTKVLLTGDSRQAQASEVSTYAVQPQMEDFRSMAIEWIEDLYVKACEMNGFSIKNRPEPNWKPVRLQDYVKTAAIFAAAFAEGNISRTTRAESIGTDFETETELMKDEKKLMKGLDAFPPMPYSPLPPVGVGGRPLGSQNVPVNNRNSGVKPAGQKPLSRIKAQMMDDAEVVELIDNIAKAYGIEITPEDIIEKE